MAKAPSTRRCPDVGARPAYSSKQRSGPAPGDPSPSTRRSLPTLPPRGRPLRSPRRSGTPLRRL
eukprot:2250127-Lingulodinium_polyedra.AAC.1